MNHKLAGLLAATFLLGAQPSLAALSISSLTASSNTTNNPASTASINPTAGSVTYLCVAYATTGGTGDTQNEDVITPSGARATWTEIAQLSSQAAAIARRGLMVFRGTGAVTNEAISITVTPSVATWTETAWNVIQVTGQDSTPDDTPQVNGAGSGTTSSTADVGTPGAGDAVIQCVFHENDEAVAATGWSALGAVTGGSDIRTLHSFYDDSSPDETPNATWSTSSTWGAAAWIVNAAAGGSVPTISSATPSGTLATTTTATLGATSDDSTGTFYGVVDTDSLSGITATQIKAEQDAGGGAVVDGCNASVTTTSPSCGVTGLTANTAYNYAVVHTNTTGDSNVETGTFTTAAEASTAVAVLDYYRRLLTQ